MAFSQFNKNVNGARRGQGGYTNGIWNQGPLFPLSIQTSVQPPRPSDLQRLPEGRRTDRSYALYTKNVVLEGDLFILYDEVYEVLHVELWGNKVLPHYRAIAVRMTDMDPGVIVQPIEEVSA